MSYRFTAPSFGGSRTSSAIPSTCVRVAQGTHQYMIDNPRGFEDAILSAIRGAASHVAVLVTAPIGAGFGRHYGAHAQIFKRVTGVKPCVARDEVYTHYSIQTRSGRVQY